MRHWAALTALGLALSTANAEADCEVSAAAPGIDASIVLSQVGWGQGSIQEATLHTKAASPVAWELLDDQGTVVASGMTIPFGDDALAGTSAHKITVPDNLANASGLKLKACGATSRAFTLKPRPYDQLSKDALHYFYLNRAGVDILSEHVPSAEYARDAGHVEETVSCWSGRDKWGTKWPACSHSLDVSGGWYDAGDFGKYVVNGGISVWTLQNLAERLKPANADGFLNVPEAGNGIGDILDEARVGMEFLLAMQVPEGAKVAVAKGQQRNGRRLRIKTVDAGGMAHHKVHEKKWLGLPLLPKDAKEDRFLLPPSTSATLNLAAAAAQCARLWKDIDAAFAQRCLQAAERAFEAARRHPDVIAYDNFDGGGAYGDQDVSDEFLWAAIELVATTGDTSYLQGLPAAASEQRDVFWANAEMLASMTILTVDAPFSA
ncbi:MAG: glycoside hydrolase family 9 protein, partial [Parvularculaceae bacterium]|nr:glycoside hydrolase family 9 protein [Parvularculaceae bacterium]